MKDQAPTPTEEYPIFLNCCGGIGVKNLEGAWTGAKGEVLLHCPKCGAIVEVV